MFLSRADRCKCYFSINPLSTNVPLLNLPENIRNLRFSDVFRGYRSGTLIENELKTLFLMSLSVLSHSRSPKFRTEISD